MDVFDHLLGTTQINQRESASALVPPGTLLWEPGKLARGRTPAMAVPGRGAP
jgi:hypothetical protein